MPFQPRCPVCEAIYCKSRERCAHCGSRYRGPSWSDWGISRFADAAFIITIVGATALAVFGYFLILAFVGAAAFVM